MKREPWGASEASVRAVRRVRIEAGPAPAAATHAPRPLDRADARQVWAKNHQARWRPLDALDTNPVEPAEDTGPAYPETTVRVIRRGAPQSAAVPSSWTAASSPGDGSGAPHPDDRSQPGAERSSTQPAAAQETTHRARPAIPRPTPERLHPTPKSPDPGASEERRGGIFGSLARLGLRFQGERDGKPSSLDAPDREPGSAVPVPVSAGARAHAHAGDVATYAEAAAPPAASRAAKPGSPPTFVDDDAFGDGFVDMDVDVDDTGRPARTLFGPASATRPSSAMEAAERSPTQRTSASSRANEVAQDALPLDVAVSSSDPGRSQPSSPTSSRPVSHAVSHPASNAVSNPVTSERTTAGVPARLEDDIELLAAYLSRPATPAIVRAERVAEELGMSAKRAERALDRLSEDRDRFDRIRPGAYMVRQRQRA